MARSRRRDCGCELWRGCRSRKNPPRSEATQTCWMPPDENTRKDCCYKKTTDSSLTQRGLMCHYQWLRGTGKLLRHVQTTYDSLQTSRRSPNLHEFAKTSIGDIHFTLYESLWPRDKLHALSTSISLTANRIPCRWQAMAAVQNKQLVGMIFTLVLSCAVITW